MNKREIHGVWVFVFMATTLLYFSMFIAFEVGALDNANTWTASDMRGEYQRRLTDLNERIADEDVPWKRAKLQADLDELKAITEPYDAN